MLSLLMATTIIAQCLIKTAMWDWSLYYWNFREITLQNKNCTKTSYKVLQIPYSTVPTIFIESQSFQQQNLAPTQHNSPQNTVSVWPQEINDPLSNLIIKEWNFCAKARSNKSDIQTVFTVYKEFHKTVLGKNDGRAVNHSLQDFHERRFVSADMHFMSRTVRSTLCYNIQNGYLWQNYKI